MGTPDFAIPTLERIAQSNHQVVAVITGQDKPVGRGRKLHPPAVKIAAKGLGYPILQPDALGDGSFHGHLRDMAADIIVVVAFRILPDEVLSIPPHGAVNLHPSLLPAYRGAAPVRHALLQGDTTTGVTTISLSRRIDAGDILMQRELDILPEDDHGSLSARLAVEGAQLMVDTLDGLAGGSLSPRPQSNQPDAPKAPKITAADQEIIWARPATEIVNRIRAFSPTPGAVTTLAGEKIKLFKATLDAGQGEPGTVLEAGNTLALATGEGAVRVGDVQLAGRKRMKVGDFLRGVPIEIGTVLGSA